MNAYIRSLFDSSVSEEYILNFRKIISYLVKDTSYEKTTFHDNLLIIIYGEGNAGKRTFVRILRAFFRNNNILDHFTNKILTKCILNNEINLGNSYLINQSNHFLKLNDNTIDDSYVDFLKPRKHLPLNKMIVLYNENNLSTLPDKYKNISIPIYLPNTFKIMSDAEFNKSIRFTREEFRDYFNVPVDIEELHELRRYFQKLIQ